MRSISVLLFLILAGCVSTTDYDALRQEVNGLQRDYFQMKKDLESLKDRTAGAVNEDSFTAMRESQAELNARISEMSMNVQELRGRFEENKYYFDKSLKETRDEREILQSRMDRLESRVNRFAGEPPPAQTLTEGVTPPETVPDAVAPPPPPPADQGLTFETPPVPAVQEPARSLAEPLDRTEAYERAYNAYKDGKYAAAREEFVAFTRQYPDNELTDNAQFWVAETYYAERDFEGAILAYENLLKKYPESEKVAGALLKQGFAFIEIGDKKTGQIILEKLVERFPDSHEADVAKKKLLVITKKR